MRYEGQDMGFFDEISKGISKGINKGINNNVSQNISDMLSSAVNTVVDSTIATEAVDKLFGKEIYHTDIQRASERTAGKEFVSEGQDHRSYQQKDLDNYFSTILAESFSGLQVQKGVAASILGWTDTSMSVKNYDFLLKENEKVKGVIMLTPHNRDNNRAFKNAKAIALKENVPFINFYTHYPNERGYVIDRINSFLG